MIWRKTLSQVIYFNPNTKTTLKCCSSYSLTDTNHFPIFDFCQNWLTCQIWRKNCPSKKNLRSFPNFLVTTTVLSTTLRQLSFELYELKLLLCRRSSPSIDLYYAHDKKKWNSFKKNLIFWRKFLKMNFFFSSRLEACSKFTPVY